MPEGRDGPASVNKILLRNWRKIIMRLTPSVGQFLTTKQTMWQ